jgi:1-acyl-sn-glycerol-3-phosphate acyltransferase
VYRFVKGLVGFLLRLFASVRIEGAEHVPAEGPLLVVTNHLSYMDPPLILVAMPRRMHVFAARKYQSNPFLRWLFESMGCIWVRQADADPQALRDALEYLRAGGGLGLSPEGTRSKVTHALIRARSGAAYLASRSGARILPMAVWGTETLFRGLLRFRRGNLHARIGTPFLLEIPPHAKGDALDAGTDDIMCAVAALLPPEYRGVYANHPRLAHWLTRMNP